MTAGSSTEQNFFKVKKNLHLIIPDLKEVIFIRHSSDLTLKEQ
jgi:hypothetical protein